MKKAFAIVALFLGVVFSLNSYSKDTNSTHPKPIDTSKVNTTNVTNQTKPAIEKDNLISTAIVSKIEFPKTDSLVETLTLNQEIWVKVDNLSELTKSKGANTVFVPVIDDVKITAWASSNFNVNSGIIKFILKRPNKVDKDYDAQLKAFASVFGRPGFTLHKRIDFTIAIIDSVPINSYYVYSDSKNINYKTIDLQQIKFLPALINSIVFIGFFLFLLYVSRNSNLIRITVPEPVLTTFNLKYTDIAYSFSDLQMLAWTALILGSTIFIWIATGEISNLTTSAIVLLGISAGTNISAKTIAYANKKNVVITTSNLYLYKSEGFLYDIFKEGDEYSPMRIQQIVWTILFMAYFIHSVWETLAIPELDTNWLILMGVSSGIYVAGKSVNK